MLEGCRLVIGLERSGGPSGALDVFLLNRREFVVLRKWIFCFFAAGVKKGGGSGGEDGRREVREAKRRCPDEFLSNSRKTCIQGAYD